MKPPLYHVLPFTALGQLRNRPVLRQADGPDSQQFTRFMAPLSTLIGLVFLLVVVSGLTGQAQTIPCNYRELITNNFSVSVSSAHTVATGPGSVTNTGNVIDADATNYGSIISTGAGGGGSLSAQVTGITLPIGSTAGFAVQNTTLASNTLPGSLTITTYLNGVQQDVSSAPATPLIERNDLATASGRRVFGIVTTKAFNEVQITFLGAASTLRVYNAFVLYPALTTMATASSASSPLASDGIVRASATGGRLPYGSYTYTGPGTSATTSSSVLTGRAPGSYTVTVTDGNGCTDADVTTVGVPPQFACTPNIAFLVNSPTTPIASTARRINLSTGVTSILATDITSGTSVNGLGLNPIDNYLYATLERYTTATNSVTVASNSIVRFDANFTPTYFNNLTVAAGTNSADFDKNGVYHLYNGNSGTTIMQRIDLSSGVPTQLASLTLSQSLPIGDMAFNPVDNNLYSLTATTTSASPVLYRIVVPTSTTSTVTTATVVRLGTVTGGGINTVPASSTSNTRFFGAVYMDSAGNFYVQDNSTGDVFKIPAVQLLTANQNATATFVSSTSLNIQDNDGARCSTAQVAPEATFAFNCGAATIAGSFTASGPTGQAGVLTIPITGATAGIASFTVLTAGFATSTIPYTTTLTAGQTSVTVPILYDGSGAPGTRPFSFDSEQATNAACSITVLVKGRPDLTTTITPAVNEPVAGQANSFPISVNNIGNVATSSTTSSVITLPANVSAPATFASNGFSCSTSGSQISCTTAATIAAGASLTFSVPFTPGPATIGTFLSFTNTVATTGESNTANNTATINLLPAVDGSYIYVHKKTLNEESSINFPFSVAGSVGSPFSFTLNDQPGHVGIKDIGTDNTGRLWVVGEPYSTTVNSTSSTVDGTLYYRSAGSPSWVQLPNEVGSRIDGDVNGGAVYITGAGLVKSVTGSGTVTTIGSASANFGGSLPVDIGSGQGQGIVVAVASGSVYKYNSVNNWTLLGGTGVTKVDVSPVENKIAVIAGSGGAIFAATISGTAVSYTGLTGTGGASDVTIDGNGIITVVVGSQTFQATSSTLVADGGGFAGATGITGGANGQIWVGGSQVNPMSPFGTIFTRTPNGSVYLDDERVRTGTADNSAFIPVAPGSYTVTENVPSGWALQDIDLYDPTDNSTSSVSGRNVVINVVAGEVVHVVFQDGLVQPVAVPTNCSTPYTENFGTVVAGTYGPPLTGQTSLHYLGTSISAGNGYYKMIGTTVGGRFSTTYGNGPLNEHTTNNLNDTGQMMVIDASYPPDEFYRRRLTGLVPGLVYNFSAWIASITNASLKPNVLFQIIDPTTENPLSATSTGDITTANTWQQYTLTFTATSNTIDLVLRNNNTGGGGNDLALDDISLSTTPPAPPTVAVTQQPTCATATGTITVSAPLGATYQYSIDGSTYQTSPTFTGVASGTYAVTTRFNNLTGCVSTAVSVTINGTACPAPDAGTVSAAAGGIPVANVAANDNVDGVAATPGTGGNAVITATGTYPAGITLDPATGSVSVAQGTAPGSYTVAYQLCDKLNVPVCNTTQVTITVTAGSTAAPDAGTIPASTGGTPIVNVAANDVVNGQPATLGTGGNATVASVGTYPAGITLNATTGAVNVAPGTVPGTYTLAYQLCDKLTTPTCTTGNATVTVTPSVTAAPDAGTVSSGAGGTAVANVRANDIVNGAGAASANSALSVVGTYPAGITLNTTTGAVAVAVGTTPGTYALTYQLCSTLGSTTCTTTTATITVTPSVTASPDAGTVSTGPGGTAIANVATNDRINGQAATLGTGGNATLASVGTYPPGITINPATGAVSVAPNTPVGTYLLSYQLCDKLTPATCTTGRVTVGVLCNAGNTAPALIQN